MEGRWERWMTEGNVTICQMRMMEWMMVIAMFSVVLSWSKANGEQGYDGHTGVVAARLGRHADSQRTAVAWRQTLR